MRTEVPKLALVVLLALPIDLAAQEAPPPGSVSLAAAGAEAGADAGRTASVSRARWGSAAATFFLTPFIGGIGSVVSAELASGTPATVPVHTDGASRPEYREAYREAYGRAYRPRFRRAVRTSVLITTVLFFAGAAAFAG